jgi:SAM-dependent methyltransferase
VLDYGRWLLMPGFDLCTRRRVRLQKYWKKGQRDFLDAGSGNGWFSYLAYRSGASVTAVSFSQDEVVKARTFYNERLGVEDKNLSYEYLNLYDLEQRTTGKLFDEIICYETLEHIKDDRRVCQMFFRMLKPGGVLHLCCPNADHPRWQAEVLDVEERGGHVRAGYTLASYRTLLEPIGFSITDVEGVGGAILSKAETTLSAARRRFGDVGCLPLAVLSFPLVWIDKAKSDSAFSIYVRAVKGGNQGASDNGFPIEAQVIERPSSSR